LNAASRAGENQVNQFGEAYRLPSADRFGVVDQPQRLAGAAADRLAFGFDRIEPGQELRRGRAAPGVGAGGAHPVGCLVSAAHPAGDKCRVCQDRRSEQGVIGFTGCLQCADERRVGVVGLAQVEELDPPGQQQGFGQGGGQNRVADPGCLAEQVNTHAGVLDYGLVQVRGLDIGVEAPVGGRDGRIVAGHRGRLDDAAVP
jgi:hypothetical protein